MSKRRSTSKKASAPRKPGGKIITFYSYKGGTGRSMTLANMAWVLASNGKRVLVIDWDLEAPGLHRFLHPFLDDKGLSSSEGVIDFVVNFAAEAVTPQRDPKKKLSKDWYKPHANILRYATSLDWDFFPGKGTVDFVPAGKQSPSYAMRVNAFNWQKFYDELGGYWFMDAARERMKAEYDYILIDSRTGVSDTSGVCTVQLPDILVVCFTLNSQSIEGAGAVAESVDAQRKTASGEPGVRIFPVPTRVERSEKEKLELAREAARKEFTPLLWHIDRTSQNAYWGDVEINYEPFYAYEEILAAFGDKPDHPTSMLAAIERITAHVTDQDVTRLGSMPETERLNVVSRYARQRATQVPAVISSATSQYLFYLSYAKDDYSDYLGKFYDDLSAEVRLRLGSAQEAVGFFDQLQIEVGDAWRNRIEQALQQSRVLIPIFSPRYFNSEHCGKELQYFLDRRSLIANSNPIPTEVPAQILPVIWVPFRGKLPYAARDIQAFDYFTPETYRQEGLRYLMKLSRHRDDYLELVTRLAENLLKAAERSPTASLLEPRPLEQIPSAWNAQATSSADMFSIDRAGPSTVKLVYVVARRQEFLLSGLKLILKYYGDEGGMDWKPYWPEHPAEVALFAQEVASREQLRYSSIALDDNLIKNLIDAESNNNISAIIVDPWTLMLDRYRFALMEFDKHAFVNCATFVIWNENDEETVESRSVLQSVLERTMPRLTLLKANYWDSINSAEEFRSTLGMALAKVRLTLLERVNPNKQASINVPMTMPGPVRR